MISTDVSETGLPPHSIEGEQGILGCLILAPTKAMADCRRAGVIEDWFFDLRHRDLFATILDLVEGDGSFDLLTLAAALKARRKMEAVGGLEYIAKLPDLVPSATNLGYYLELTREAFQRRYVVRTLQHSVASFLENGAEFPDLMERLRPDLESVLSPSVMGSIGPFDTFDTLSAFNHTRDDSTLLGVRANGTTSRYLCRGGSGWIIGPSGVGKSSLASQMAMLWAAGKPAFGIRPTRPLRITIIQGENDPGDLAEMIQGVSKGLGIDELEDEKAVEFIRCNLRVRSESSRIGRDFCAWLRRVVAADGSDLVIVDPLLSFAGIDVTRQDQCTAFLRNALNPVLHSTGVAILGMHHTGKPKIDSKTLRNMTALDHAYAGLGSSELVNWARLVMVLRQIDDHTFELKLPKRGKRSMAAHPNGEPADSVWLRHAFGHICWEQVDPPKEREAAVPESGEERPAGRPSKVDELIALGLGLVIDKLTEPTSQRQVAKMIETYAASRRMDVGETTCKNAIKKLVKTGGLIKTEDGYKKA